MKVMCIQKFPQKCAISGQSMPVPEIGDIDIVVGTITIRGISAYELQRFGHDNLYATCGFAILPDQSADEMQEQEREAIVNLETA